ncbi:MAG TPA: MFS transporter [Anaerolineae bacterium]|nr:MFS transporter [Anaerolineae bacterium]
MNQLTKLKQYPNLGLILLAFIAFIALGLPDGLLGVGWPSIRADFNIPLDAIGLFLTAAVIGYMTSSFLSGYLLARVGVGPILVTSCLFTGLALVGYTLVPYWLLMVLLGTLGGLGAGAIDAGLNTYVATHFSEGLMQWLHASWGIGITLGPLIMTLGLNLSHGWRLGYQIVAAFQFILALGFLLTLRLWTATSTTAPDPNADTKLTDYQTPMTTTLRQPQVWLSITLFFLYVGAETALGTWVYTLLTESRQVETTIAGIFTGSYWFTFTIGRITAGIFASRLGSHKLVIGGLFGALFGTFLLIWNPTPISNVIAVAIIGFFIAPIFPAMMSGTRYRVGPRYAANTIGMQVAATGFGTAIIPTLMGTLARYLSLEAIPISLLFVYTSLILTYTLAILYPASAPAPT